MRKIQSYEQISYQIAKNTEKYETYEELPPGKFNVIHLTEFSRVRH